jgi:hypothetical protein
MGLVSTCAFSFMSKYLHQSCGPKPMTRVDINDNNQSPNNHPKTDGQTERVNQVIEDMLKIYVMDKPSKWEDYLHLAEFVYNNGYQASLKMSPFEALYGRKWNTPVSWDNPTDREMVGLELLREMEEKMLKIKQNLKAAQDR